MGMAVPEVLQWYKTVKSNAKCIVCNLQHPAAIEFHHRDEKEKKHTISHMVFNGFDITAIKEELEKCDPMCANHHRIHHYNQRNHVA
jgi:hypothetical protein